MKICRVFIEEYNSVPQAVLQSACRCMNFSFVACGEVDGDVYDNNVWRRRKIGRLEYDDVDSKKG